MRSTDKRLNDIFRYAEAQNRVTGKRLSQLDALRIYGELIHAGRK